ncbi:MAG: hypothetical protein JSW21_10640 [Gammaproteobacteria bacterium]|nr:MAG: hypothetical protein JSW21_10640 [Gammaproteobacteria bacterium]
MSWQYVSDSLHEGRVLRQELRLDSHQPTWGDIIEGWRRDPTFRDFFIQMLATAPFPAYYFETPPLGEAALAMPFEFALIDSTLLAGVDAEPHVFESHFDGPAMRDGITVFDNLGGDAVLIAPCPTGPLPAYAHLAAFARLAPPEQQHALWKRVAETINQRLKLREPLWLSTAGQGVFWLHVRLDRYPKYYNYQPYRQARSS